MLNKFEVAGLFSIAEIPWDCIQPIRNEYWDKISEKLASENPWYLVLTKFGSIKIGPRKRVYEIDWTDTKIRKVISEDGVTKGETFIHAWSLEKASKYLRMLGKELNKILEDDNKIKYVIKWIDGKHEQYYEEGYRSACTWTSDNIKAKKFDKINECHRVLEDLKYKFPKYTFEIIPGVCKE